MNKLIAFLTPTRLKLLLIALPVVLAIAYFSWLSADRYVSESIVTVRQASHESSAVPGAALLLAGINPPSREDTLYLRQYIHSLALLNRLDAELGLRAHYEAEKVDVFYRLWSDTSQESFLEYYRARVGVLFDEVSSLLTVRVEGFEPAFAQKLNAAILRESEAFVNAFSQRMAREQMQFAETEREGAAARLQTAKATVLTFQNKHGLLDPQAQAQASGALMADLQAALTRQETELRALRGYLNEDTFQVQALRNQVQATTRQLEAESQRVTRGKNEGRLNEQAARFQDLMLQAGFAQDAYKLALTAVENARIDATRKLKSLVVIEPPGRPETAEYPRRLYNILTVLIVCCLLYGVTRLAVATIREHQD